MGLYSAVAFGDHSIPFQLAERDNRYAIDCPGPTSSACKLVPFLGCVGVHRVSGKRVFDNVSLAIELIMSLPVQRLAGTLPEPEHHVHAVIPTIRLYVTGQADGASQHSFHGNRRHWRDRQRERETLIRNVVGLISWQYRIRITL